MKRNRFGMKQVMAVLLCFILVLGSAGTTAYAGEPVQEGAEEAYDSEALVPAAEETASEEAASGEDISEEDGTTGEEELSEEGHNTGEGSGDPSFDGGSGEMSDTAQEDAQSADGVDAADDEDASQGQDEQPDAAEGTDEKPVEESGEAASEETGALIEEPLSDDEAMATDNAAMSGDSWFSIYSFVYFIF